MGRLRRWAGRVLRRPASGAPGATRAKPPRSRRPPVRLSAYRGDFHGKAKIEYAPNPDGLPDPGEIVWAWVPYEDDPNQGKDRPVLVLARQDGDLLALMLTSKDHTADAARHPDDQRRWYDLGTGTWDTQRRPSEVRLDRVLRLAPSAVRREGAALDRRRFDAVAAAARRVNRW